MSISNEYYAIQEDEGIEFDTDKWISKCKEILLKEGYSVEDNYILSKNIKWRPHIFASKDGDKKAIDIRVINELDEDYIEGLETAVNTLRDVDVFLAFPEKMLIEPIIIQQTNKSKVGILRIFENKLEVLVEAGKEISIKPEKKEIVPKKHLSQSLLKEIKSISNLEYAQELKVFAGLYESKEFKSIDEEYKFVLKFLTDLLQDKYSKRIVAEGLIGLKELEPFLKKGKIYYREHFLHSVQVFLLGSSIIDKNYNTFDLWYKRGFPAQNQIKIDFPWLLTSIYHDVGYPLQKLDAINERVLEQFFNRRSPNIKIHLGEFLKDKFYNIAIKELTSLHKHLKSDKIQENWAFKPSEEDINGFHKVLLKNLNKRNHGILSALILLKKVSLEDLFSNTGYIEGPYSKAVYPAALAMALHDKPLWDDLEIRDELPIKIEKTPLCSLLIFCDNVQEWGRPGTVDVSSAFSLSKVEIKENAVRITLNCNDFSIAKSRKIEHQRVKDILKSDVFNFEIEVKTGYLC